METVSASSHSRTTTTDATMNSDNQQGSSQTTEGLFGKWPSQLPQIPLMMDNWTMYQIQSMRTVSGLRGELPSEKELRELTRKFDLTSRTLIPEAPPPSGLAPQRSWWRRFCGMFMEVFP